MIRQIEKGRRDFSSREDNSMPFYITYILFPVLPLTYYVTLSESFHLHVTIFSFVKWDNKYYFLSLSWVMLLSPSINIYWMPVGRIMLR